VCFCLVVDGAWLESVLEEEVFVFACLCVYVCVCEVHKGWEKGGIIEDIPMPLHSMGTSVPAGQGGCCGGCVLLLEADMVVVWLCVDVCVCVCVCVDG
jgi:hypothetical protein